MFFEISFRESDKPPAAGFDTTLKHLEEIWIAGYDDAQLDELWIVAHVFCLNVGLHVDVGGKAMSTSSTLEHGLLVAQAVRLYFSFIEKRWTGTEITQRKFASAVIEE